MTTATKPQRGDTDHVRAALAVDIHAAWRDQAACAGLDMNPEPDSPEESRALAVCDTCPVLRDCSRWVMPLNEYTDPGGICGGMTERGRARLRTSTAIKAGMAKADSKKEAVMTTTNASLGGQPSITITPESARFDSGRLDKVLNELGTPAAMEQAEHSALLALIARTLGQLAKVDDPAAAKDIIRAREALTRLETTLTVSEKRRQAEADIETAKAALAAAQERLRELKSGKTTAIQTPARTADEPTPKEIRAWAAQNDIYVAKNGSIPAPIRQQYDAAHEDR